MANTSGLHIFADSGVPTDTADHTTLVILHGSTIHSGNFTRLLPLGKARHARIVLVNRRDYPGAVPYTESEQLLLSDAHSDDEVIKSNLALFMKQRAQELLGFLVELVQAGGVTPAEPIRNKGGIVVAGWSLGQAWMTALLAHASSSPASSRLREYIRRVVLYDPPSFLFGYPRPSDPYDPFLQSAAEYGDPQKILDWVSGYFDHGPTVDTLERRIPSTSPTPTLRAIPLEELPRMVHPPPGQDGGSDHFLVVNGHRVGFFRGFWQDALRVSPESTEDASEEWRDVEVRLVYCDRSTWECVHAAWHTEIEQEEAQKTGLPIRKLFLTRIRGGNHFVHWDYPEETLVSMLDEEAVVTVGSRLA
ncbi:hypothetical protein BD311DRAFT_755099 [Dichomitus squalens]|uniref:AB hydrolase-1 domain-containing protein n=1 Tax=Dichomitus squalens TaxID=114155 RepID=A0A4Q9MV10_9APHY|nr:hypothetical protein BD311DRAFT_755099 [Dichomitus squalens]